MPIRYYIEIKQDGRRLWWRPSTIAYPASWVDRMREAQSYASEGNAKSALTQIVRWHKPAAKPYVIEKRTES